jgi:hypothetical protein
VRFGPFGLDPAHVLEYATIYAAGLGRRDAVALLLEYGPDLAFREPVYNNTVAAAARYCGHPEILTLLDAAHHPGHK